MENGEHLPTLNPWQEGTSWSTLTQSNCPTGAGLPTTASTGIRQGRAALKPSWSGEGTAGIAFRQPATPG